MRQGAKEGVHIGKRLTNSAWLKHSMFQTASDKIIFAVSIMQTAASCLSLLMLSM